MHTLGPWLVNDADEDIVIMADFISVDDSLNIATVHCGLPMHECKANAFLIAAAPDMLAALKLVDEKWASNQGNVLDIVQAAIARAEGRRRNE